MCACILKELTKSSPGLKFVMTDTHAIWPSRMLAFGYFNSQTMDVILFATDKKQKSFAVEAHTLCTAIIWLRVYFIISS